MKITYILLIISLVIVVAAIVFLPSRLRIITGYAAKSMCSCVFVANRTPESVILKDIKFSFVKYAKAWVVPEEKAAYSTVFGMAKRKAVYRQGLGCSLVFDSDSSKENPAFNLPSFRQNTGVWPVGDEVKDTVFESIDYEKLNVAVDNAFDFEGEETKNTRVVLVNYKDHIVAEKYAEGFDENTRQLGWSMTKSMTNAMIGLLVKENKLEIKKSNLLEEWKNDDRNKISINDLLHMSSGLKWNEAYGDQSDATIMLYQKTDKAGYAINRPLEFQPGERWVYSSGTSNILQKIIRNTFSNDEAYWRYPYENLFQKIGMTSTIIETDNKGLFVGSSYGYATPRDWARFGLLYLHDGMWNGERILPEGWVKYTSTSVPDSNGQYGAHFWINDSGVYATAPRDMFLCQGFHGQRVFIIPSMDLVIVRLGVSPEDTFDFNLFLKEILAAFN